jgi:hypothetical protein
MRSASAKLDPAFQGRNCLIRLGKTGISKSAAKELASPGAPQLLPSLDVSTILYGDAVLVVIATSWMTQVLCHHGRRYRGTISTPSIRQR